MATAEELQPGSVSGFSTENIEWVHLEGGPEFDFPIDYWIAVLGAQPENGRVDFLVKWEPNAYCHYHRHLGETTTIVLEGEHHVVETSPIEEVHKTRTMGHYAKNPAGDLHMEYGGPEGSVLLFSMHAPDGNLFEILDKDENILTIATIDGLVSGELGG